MSPNHQGAAPAATTAVACIADKKRQKRVEYLLDARSELARIVGEKRSHRTDDAEGVAGVQYAVEAAICDEFPDVFDEQFATWLADDATREHAPGQINSSCSICQTIAGPQHAAPSNRDAA